MLKRAQYFLCCRGYSGSRSPRRELVARALLDPEAFNEGCEQLSLFSAPQVQQLAGQGVAPRLAGLQVKEEAVKCIARQM